MPEGALWGTHMCVCVHTHTHKTHIIMLFLKETDLSLTHTLACKTVFLKETDFFFSLCQTHTHTHYHFPFIYSTIQIPISPQERTITVICSVIKKKEKNPDDIISIQCKRLHTTWSTWDENMNRTACLRKTRIHAVRICRSFIVPRPSYHWYMELTSMWTTYLDNFVRDHAVSICPQPPLACPSPPPLQNP